MIRSKINSEFSGEINEIQFDDKKLYVAVLKTVQRIEKDGFEITKDLIAELSDFFEKISESLEISYEKTSETLDYVFEYSEENKVETNELIEGFHNIADIENEICEYASIYGEYIATCDRLSAELQKLTKIED